MAEIPRNKSTEHQFTAFVDYYLTFPAYLGSYKRSFDILMESVAQSNLHVDHIAYPILFIARHCMELGLKTNIRYFAKYSEKDDFTKAGTHDLSDLFRAFTMHVESTFITLKGKYGIVVDRADKRSFRDLCGEVEKLNAIFHELDRNSDAFRYPVNTDEKASFRVGDRVNIIGVNDLLDRSMLLFVHTADVFAKYTEYADQIESYYEGLMRDEFEQNIPF